MSKCLTITLDCNETHLFSENVDSKDVNNFRKQYFQKTILTLKQVTIFDVFILRWINILMNYDSAHKEAPFNEYGFISKKQYLHISMQNEEEPKDNDKTLVFKEYSSLELSTRDKFIQGIRNAGLDNKEIQWVASEKIHGSNFSILFNGETARYGRRTDFLTKEIPVPCENPGEYFNESFYDARNLVARFHNKLTDIYTTIKEFDPKMIKFTIYGEYFGGSWPANHPNSVKGGPKAVQKGIYYTPEQEFMAFDIFIVTVETAYWVDVFDIPKLLKENIKAIPVHTKGTFDEVFNINTVIDSTIPELLGLPKLQKNIIEGMVIRPNKNVKNENNDRVIIKKKNQEFLEKVAEPKEGKKKEKKEVQVDPEIAPFLEELLKYLNLNRIDSVVSKFPDLKDRNKLKELVLKDILTDAGKDEIKLPDAEDEKHKKLIKELTNYVMKEVNSYFIKH